MSSEEADASSSDTGSMYSLDSVSEEQMNIEELLLTNNPKVVAVTNVSNVGNRDATATNSEEEWEHTLTNFRFIETNKHESGSGTKEETPCQITKRTSQSASDESDEDTDCSDAESSEVFRDLLKADHSVYKRQEYTLAEIGYSYTKVDGWDDIMPDKLPPLKSRLKEAIAKKPISDLGIRIGIKNFPCTSLILQSYSTFFERNWNQNVISLPEDQVSVTAFCIIHNWMRSDMGNLQRDGIVEVFKAALYLEIPDLITQCQQIFEQKSLFDEGMAFDLYREACEIGVNELSELMVPRIRTFFLVLVASSDFLLLSVEHVVPILASNNIRIHCEMEVLLSAIRWLLFDWKKRKYHVKQIIECVHMAELPAWFLSTLYLQVEFEQMEWIMEHVDVAPMVMSGLPYASNNLFFGDNPVVHKAIGDILDLKTPELRGNVEKDPLIYNESELGYPSYRGFLVMLSRIQDACLEMEYKPQDYGR